MDKINLTIIKMFEESIEVISKLASIQFFIIIIITTYILNIEEIFKGLILGLILITLIGSSIRFFLFKDRPKKEKFDNFIEKIKASSFPSMHSARMSFLILFFYGIINNINLEIFLLILYLIVCFQRYYSKKHDLYDLIGGLILGICVSLFISNLKGF